MDRALAYFSQVLDEHDCPATFAITASALARQPRKWACRLSRNIELAAHGLFHIDHTRLPLDQLTEQFTQARRVFDEREIPCEGFRLPYLRWNPAALEAISQSGYLYEGSHSLAWDVVGEQTTEAYHHVLSFYGSVPASRHAALPHLKSGLVTIPYCLPDDEALVDRLNLITALPMQQMWLAILEETHRRGELFTLGLHPERIYLCAQALEHTLRRARELKPQVWIARLSEIAHWWKARLDTRVTVNVGSDGSLHLGVDGPDGITLLVRNCQADGLLPWEGLYRQVNGQELRLFASRHRPFIGLSPVSSPHLHSFLWQQGYLVETAADAHNYQFYLDEPDFAPESEGPLLDSIEQAEFPLIRIGRWPHGAKSALSITGDIDALTIWDYGFRWLGR
jgi:peptidoglycan/xylan/chitin deacetylase (PgdA/CDA1 family)